MNTSSYIKDDHDVYESQELEIESVRAYNMTSFRFAGLLLQACSRLETKPDSIPAKNKGLKQKKQKAKRSNTNQMVAQLLAPSIQVNRAGSTQFAWFLGRIITGKPVLTCERYSASVASSSLQWGRSTQTIQKSARTSSPSSQRRTVPSALVEASSKSSGE